MAHILKPRVAETSTSTGAGDFALAAALAGHQRFSAVCATSDTTEYMIVAADGSWEEGVGTYSAANTLTRTTVTNSSNGGAAVNFAAGSKTVLMTPIASRVGSIPRGGSSGQALVKASATDYDALWSAIVGVASDVQTFNASGTWTKPAGATWVYVEITGGGGGGGSGRRGTTQYSGGSGGGGGAGVCILFKATDLTSTVTVTVGAGGTGGTAQTVDGTNGNAGTAGGSSSFGTYASADGGGAGQGGTSSSATAPVSSSALTIRATAGARAAVSDPSPLRTLYRYVAGSGGGGSGETSAVGGLASGSLVGAGGAGGSTAGAAGTAGTAGGGGGGGSGVPTSGTTTGGTGGAGAQPGGGGGGGGGSPSGYNSGAGGAGGDGRVLVYSW